MYDRDETSLHNKEQSLVEKEKLIDTHKPNYTKSFFVERIRSIHDIEWYYFLEFLVIL